jgi:hypothetical protein
MKQPSVSVRAVSNDQPPGLRHAHSGSRQRLDSLRSKPKDPGTSDFLESLWMTDISCPQAPKRASTSPHC